MEINNLSTNLPGGTAKASITDLGLGSFQIGGTLIVASGQASGEYKGQFSVTINYP
jgi:hypothetical protein